MDNQKWEVVSYGKSKKGGAQKMTKAEKKKRASAMPTLSANDHLANAKTGFSLGDDSSSEASDGFSPIEVVPKKTASPTATKQKQKNNPQKQKPAKPKSVKEILNTIDVEELRSTYTGVSKAFPDQPVIWLTDVAAFIDRKFPLGTPGLEKDWYTPSGPDDAKDFPLADLHKAATNYLSNVIESINTVHLSNFIFSACQQLLLSVSRGTSSIGLRLMMQLVFKRSPRFLLSQTAELSKMATDSRNNPQHFFALFWCFTQAGRLSFEVGSRVLLDLMMPHINIKAFGVPIVSFAEDLITLPDARRNNDTIGYRDFFPLLDVMHASTLDEKSIPTNIAPNLMKRLQALYPSTKNIGFLCRNDEELKTFFPSLLYRLRSKGSEKLRDELLSCLTHCLINSPQSFGVWKQMHAKHLSQSYLLLCHVLKQWPWLHRRLNRSAVRDLLKHFIKQHGLDPPNSEGRRIADNAQLILDNSGPSTMERSLRLLLYLMIFVSTLLAVDVWQHGGFKNSICRATLDKVALAEPAEKVWNRAAQFTKPLLAYLSEKTCCLFHSIGPIMQKAWAQVVVVALAVYEVMRPYLMILWEKVEYGVVEVEKNWPHVVEFVSKYLQILGEYLVQAFWIIVRFARLCFEYLKNVDWTPVIAFSNQCWTTTTSYMDWAYKNVCAMLNY